MNLERPRTPSEEQAPVVVTRARFEPQSEIPLAIETADEQPFIRCPSCEADNNKMAERCFNCQRPLLTPEVRAWNEVFWQKRKEAEEQPPPAAAAAPPMSEENRRLAEALAAVELQREKTRLWWMPDAAQDSTPAGMKLLGLFPPNRRYLAAAAMAAAFFFGLLIALTASGHPALRVIGGGVAMLLLLLFVPNTRRRPRWWDFFD
ncbi:MAG TPA: hypothetical protein VLW85_01380 [Myxococcales bacterium]|nr:hypothetical protein [Myxococcales bacterium]